MGLAPALRDAAFRWIADDPDPSTRSELQQLLAQAMTGVSGAAAELAARMAGPLRFGTAGLRGPVRAGPAGMNVAVVTRATAGLAGWLTARGEGGRPVVVGRDARHGSEAFARAAAGVLAGAGFSVAVLPGPLPTPLLAFSVRRLGAAAGVQITASHNPAGDNGYKVYLADGAQLAPPSDAEIEAAIAAAPPAVSVPLAPIPPTSVSEAADLTAPIPPTSIPPAADPPAPNPPTSIPPAADPPAWSPPGGIRSSRIQPGSVPPGGIPPVSVPPGGAYSTCDPTEEYLDRVARLPRGGARELRIALTPLHGVGGATAVHALARVGFTDVHVVAAQAAPDPDFPTVAFPNPEEPGATDALLALAAQVGADLAVALDPDADRCALGVPLPGGGWRMLSGDETGVLLGDHILRSAPVDARGPARVSARADGGARDDAGARAGGGVGAGPGTGAGVGACTGTGVGIGTETGVGAEAGKGTETGAGAETDKGTETGAGAETDKGTETGAGAGAGAGPEQAAPLVATTVVSSSMLGRIAAAYGARYAETLTGFKWITRAGSGLVFGYEEALGYCVDPEAVRDKDGIAAAVLAADLTATLRRAGATLLDRLDELALAHGVHRTEGISLRMDPTTRDAVLARLLAAPPTGWTTDRPAPDVLRLRRDGERVVIRPSGTEPKLKTYLEIVEEVAEGDTPARQRLAEARQRAEARLATLRTELTAMLSTG